MFTPTPSPSNSAPLKMSTPTPTLSNQTLTLIPSLPNDISINILAGVPRAYHPSLSLVSKAFDSLLSSPLVFTTRSLINSTETSLFITLQLRKDPLTSHFFTLRNRRLIPLPPIPGQPVGSSYAALGPCIYALGGRSDIDRGKASAGVWIFDCRSNKWAAGPRMHVARKLPMFGVVDGKLYVIGGCENGISVEIYDPDIGSWGAVETFVYRRRIPKAPFFGSTVIAGKIYAMALGGLVAYDVGTRVCEYIIDICGTLSCCILNGVLYWCDLDQIRGFDLEKGHEEAITGTGLEGDDSYGYGNMQLVNFDGKLVAVWQKIKDDKVQNYEVRCMEIDVKKGKNGELQGNVCFNDSVLVLQIGLY